MWKIRKLDKQANRAAFTCGDTNLDAWLQRQASQSVEKHQSSVWIASPNDQRERIAGYYSLAPWQITFDEAPATLTKRLPRYPLTVTLLARLAVDQNNQGNGLGGTLLVDALKRIYTAAQTVPVHAALVHAKDQNAASFYQHYGFIPFKQNRIHLFLPMKTLTKLYDH